MNPSIPLPQVLPGTGAVPVATLPSPPLSLLPINSDDAAAPAFANCLGNICERDPETGTAPDVETSSDVAGLPRLPWSNTAARSDTNTIDTIPDTSPEPAHNLAERSGTKRPHDSRAATQDAPWPPDGLSSLLLLPPIPELPPQAQTTVPAPTISPDITENLPADALGAAQRPLPSCPAQPTDNLQQIVAEQPDSINISDNPSDNIPAQIPVNTQFQPIAAEHQRPDGLTQVSTAPTNVTSGETSAAHALPAAENAILTPPLLPPAMPAPPPARNDSLLPLPDVHADNFPGTMASHISWLAEQGIGRAHIHITPSELGPIEIRLTLEGEQLSAHFASLDGDVRQALQHSLPQLRESLGEYGLQLAHADVSQQHDKPTSSNTDTDINSESKTGSTDAPSPATKSNLRTDGSPPHSLHGLHLLDAYA